jgi:hypothetical protein
VRRQMPDEPAAFRPLQCVARMHSLLHHFPIFTGQDQAIAAVIVIE